MKKFYHIPFIAFYCLAFTKLAAQGFNAYQYSIPKVSQFSRAAAVAGHPLASAVGAGIMKQGGNAVDAAIAMQWTLAVVFPEAGNIGGGGFMVLHLANGKDLTLDYRERAPLASSENMYVDAKTGKANTRLSQSGHLAVGVPGTVAGLFAAHTYARLPMSKLIAPAIALAEKGFAITEREAKQLNGLQQQLDRTNVSPNVFMRAKEWKAGDTLKQTDLANTLKRISLQGAKGFYEGETARLIVNEMERAAGIITLADLKAYKPVWRKPLTFSYRGHDVVTMPPPSSGGILLQQMLGMLEMMPMGNHSFQSSQAVQRMIEVERLAFADRAEHLGDPDYYAVPVAGITSKTYLQQRLMHYDSTKAGISDSTSYGVPTESMQTTHLSVIDSAGNAVSVTTTLNGNYGGKVVVSGAGFFLNNEMDDFSIQPGVPNMFGAVGGKANAIMPGKRMLSSMTPTIVLKDGKPEIIVGARGGTTIITSVLQTITSLVDFNLNPVDAIYRPKFHHQHLPDEVRVENEFPQTTIDALQKMGYKVVKSGSWSATNLIYVSPTGMRTAVGDIRGDDAVAGY